MAFHPVQIAPKRVDFAIVGQHPKWLCKPPLRERIGRITLVIDRKSAFEPLVHEIGVKLGHLLGEHHAFVND